AVVLGFVALGAFWRFGPLGRRLDVHHLAALGEAVRARPDVIPLVLGVYLLAALAFFPMTWLIAAPALVFPPLQPFGLGLTGALAAAAMTYGIGRVVARYRPGWVEGPRLERVRERLRRRGIAAVAGLRLVPVGNFSLVNIAVATLGVPFRAYMLGNLLGQLPSLLLLTFLLDRVRAFGLVSP